MIKNPILPGFNPDPCICRKGDDYYLAVSTFEWFPGIPVYHSRDLKNWELYTHVLIDDEQVDLKKLPSAKGIWAPCLTYCEQEDLFYVVYGVMNSMNARYFDVDNYLVTAKDIRGPWSEPVYLHSSGFDASILHDDDGRKYIVSLEWETREGYEKPGAICMVEYSPEKKEIVGYPKRVWAGGSNLAKMEVPESSLAPCKMPVIPDFDDFDSEELGNWYYAPRIMPQRFADVKARPGYVRIRGQESRTSLNKVSILARKLTSVYARVTTKMEFVPEIHQHSAGLILYYDNMNYINLRKYYSETLGQSALSIIHLENGEKTEFLNTRIPVEDRPIYLRLYICGRKSWFEWSYDGEEYQKIGRIFDTTKFSDEYCKYGEFTGTMVGITCADRVKHQHYADFDFFEYKADESRGVE